MAMGSVPIVAHAEVDDDDDEGEGRREEMVCQALRVGCRRFR
jgi:hypothetical protein